METVKSGPPPCWKPCESETGRCQAWAHSQSRQCARKTTPPGRFCTAHRGTVTDDHATESLVVTEHLDTDSGLQTTPLSRQCTALPKNNTERCKRRTTHQSGLCSGHVESSQRTNTPTAGALSDELVNVSRQCAATVGEGSSQCKRRTTHASGLCPAHMRQQSERTSREATVVRSDTDSQPGRQCISFTSDGLTRCQRRTRDESGLCASHHRQNEHDAEARKSPTPAQSQTRPTVDTHASQPSQAQVTQEDNKLIDNKTRRCAAITKDGKTRCRVRTSHESGVCSTHRTGEGFEAQRAAAPEDCNLSQQCLAFTKDGSTRCKRRTTAQDGLCSVHQNEEAAADNGTEFGSAHVADDSTEESSEPRMLQCAGVTIDGQTRCKRRTAHPSGFCAAHLKQQPTPDTEHYPVTAESRTDNTIASDARRCAALTSDGVTKCKRGTTHPAGFCSTHLKQQQIASSSDMADSQASEDDTTHSEQTSSQARRCKAITMDESSRCKRHTSHPTGLCSSHLKHEQSAEKGQIENHVATQPLEAPSDAQARQCIALAMDEASRCKRHTSHPTGLCSSHLKHQQSAETDLTDDHIRQPFVEPSSQARRCKAMTSDGTWCKRHTSHSTGLCSSHLRQQQSAGVADTSIEKVRNQETAKSDTGQQCEAMTSDGTTRCKRHTSHPTGLCSSHLKQQRSAGTADTTTEKIRDHETAKNDTSHPEEHSNARRCAAVKSDGSTRCKRRTAHPSGLCSTHISRSRARSNGFSDTSEVEEDAEVPVDAYLGSTGEQQTQSDGDDTVQGPIETGQITSRRCEGITSQGSQCARRTNDSSGLCSAHRGVANQCVGMVKDGTTRCRRRAARPGGFCSVHADKKSEVRPAFPSSSSTSARRALFHDDDDGSLVAMATVAIRTEGLADMEVDEDDHVPDVFFSLSESEGESNEDDDPIGVTGSQPRYHSNSQPFAHKNQRPILSGQNHQADQTRDAKSRPVWDALTPPPTTQKHGAEPVQLRTIHSPRVHAPNTVPLTPNATGLTGTGAVPSARQRHAPAPSGTLLGEFTPPTGQTRRLPNTSRTPESLDRKGVINRSSVHSQFSQPTAPPTPDTGVDTPYLARLATTAARRSDSNRSYQTNAAPSPKKTANSHVTTVFRTPHGKKYHTATCQHFNPEFPLSIVEAHREGLGPCSKCSPPPAIIVYSSPTGTKYHTAQCRFFNPDHPVALGDAEKLGLDPCSRCSPPVV